ncbi:MAG: STAS domain-containing protein [Atopobiaceae bacterium]|nr:STAS domain-containing protein [Atopobiaceae bacterium]
MAIASIEKQASTLLVQPSGRLDTVRTPLLDKELQPHLDGINTIVMDFSQVEYITSSCLRLLLWLEQLVEDRGGEVQLTHAGSTVLKVLDLSGFRDAIHVIED